MIQGKVEEDRHEECVIYIFYRRKKTYLVLGTSREKVQPAIDIGEKSI